MCIRNNGENSKPPMHAASQYITMVARLRDFVARHSTWQIRSRHCKGSSLSSLIIDHWVQVFCDKNKIVRIRGIDAN